ncbi:MAG TPA: NUDIX domain-containing protein [Candidatus Angelobacter sp.]|nr:NUDIX domain-containing protein [Candidatus Angelobacter sp.]
MRRRPSSRILLIDSDNRVLLFKFVHKTGALAGQIYWATPGGALETGESFEDAARRELLEETDIHVDAVNEPVARREFQLQLADGEHVLAEERFFVIRFAAQSISRDHWTSLEREVMTDHHWWSVEDLRVTSERVFPETLADMIAAALDTVKS